MGRYYGPFIKNKANYMLQGQHTSKINEPISISTTGDNIIIAGASDRWIYVHELIGDLDVAGTINIKRGTEVLATFDLDAGQGITLTDEPGEDNRARFECRPGEDFIIELPAGSVFTGNVHYSFAY